jgi:hypothetical protein
MLTTRFTRLVGCSVPLQQADMGGVVTAELAADRGTAMGFRRRSTIVGIRAWSP